MLYFVAVWLLLLPSCTVIGTNLLCRFHATSLQRLGDRLIASLWLGLITLAVTFLAISLVLPLTPWVGLGVMAVLSGIVLLSQTTRIALNRLWQAGVRRRLVVLFSLLLLVAGVMSRSVVWLDTGYYHSSSIQWLANYGTVPGIALLFSNLGFTSSWFALAAPWNPSSLVAHSSAVVAGFAWLISLLQGAIAGRRVLAARAQLSDWFAFVFMSAASLLNLFLKPFSDILVSPSPDLPILLLVGTVAWAILATSQTPQQVKTPLIDAKAVPLAIAAGAFTIKLTALPLLVVSSLFFIATRPFSLRRVAIGFGLVSAILLPYLTSSVISSGCPLYPSNVMCFDLPWSPTAQAAKQIAANTHNWVSWYGTPPVGANPWLWALGQMLASSVKEAMIFGIVLGALIGAIYVLKTKVFANSALRSLRGEIWVLAIGAFGIAFLMLTSVFFRFLMPYALVLIALLIATLAADKKYIELKLLNTRQTTIGVVSLTGLILAINLAKTSGNVLLLSPAMKSDRLVRKETNGIVYTAPQSGDVQQTVQIKEQLQKDMCWAAPLPCAYYIAPEVHLRQPDRGIAGGFVRK
jgi:hypothetical protein